MTIWNKAFVWNCSMIVFNLFICSFIMTSTCSLIIIFVVCKEPQKIARGQNNFWLKSKKKDIFRKEYPWNTF